MPFTQETAVVAQISAESKETVDLVEKVCVALKSSRAKAEGKLKLLSPLPPLPPLPKDLEDE